MTLPQLDAEYARAVAESAEAPHRFDDAMARIEAGHVEVNTYYTHPVSKGSGTPLVFAVIGDALAYVEELLARGADPNLTLPAEHGSFYPPAVFYVRSLEAFDLLVKRGARLDTVSQGDESFLHHCIRMSRGSRHPLWLHLARTAIARGASPAQVDAGGRDAAAFALSMGTSIAKLYAQVLGVSVPAPATKAPTEKTASKKSAKRALAKKSSAKPTAKKSAGEKLPGKVR